MSAELWISAFALNLVGQKHILEWYLVSTDLLAVNTIHFLRESFLLWLSSGSCTLCCEVSDDFECENFLLIRFDMYRNDYLDVPLIKFENDQSNCTEKSEEIIGSRGKRSVCFTGIYCERKEHEKDAGKAMNVSYRVAESIVKSCECAVAIWVNSGMCCSCNVTIHVYFVSLASQSCY